MSESVRWLLLAYRIPSEPSRLRAGVWRALKVARPIYLQNAVAAVPEDPTAEWALRALRAEIAQMDGATAQLLCADTLVGGRDLIDATMPHATTNTTKSSIAAKTSLPMSTRTRRAHFSYWELEENDEDLTKLRGWFDKVAARDRLGAAGRDTAAKALEECGHTLDRFAQAVYAADTDAP